MKAFYPADFTVETTTGSYTEECMHKRGSMILQLKEKRINGKNIDIMSVSMNMKGSDPLRM